MKSYANRPVRYMGSKLDKRWNSEGEVEHCLCESLNRQGVPTARQVKTNYGIIDVLTENAIYEVKIILSNENVRRAIGQLFCYKMAYPNRKMVIVAQSGDASPHLLNTLHKYNIEVIILNKSSAQNTKNIASFVDFQKRMNVLSDKCLVCGYGITLETVWDNEKYGNMDGILDGQIVHICKNHYDMVNDEYNAVGGGL